MGNSLKKQVSKITNTKLLYIPYLIGPILCPVCKKQFGPTETQYLFRLHVIICYEIFDNKKVKRIPEKIKKNAIKAGNLLKSRFDKVRINWEKGCDEIFIDRLNLLENSLIQIDLVNFYKVFSRF